VKQRGAVGGRLMFQTAEFQVDDERVVPVLELARGKMSFLKPEDFDNLMGRTAMSIYPSLAPT